MNNAISKQARAEFLQTLRQCYRAACKQEKTRLLDEFVSLAKSCRNHRSEVDS